MPSGVKSWLYLYPFGGQRLELNLGSYPEVSLETARSKFEEARKKVKNGVDPLAEKAEAAEERRHELTFDQLAREYIANNVDGQLVDFSAYGIRRILLTSGKPGGVVVVLHGPNQFQRLGPQEYSVIRPVLVEGGFDLALVPVLSRALVLSFGRVHLLPVISSEGLTTAPVTVATMS